MAEYKVSINATPSKVVKVDVTPRVVQNDIVATPDSSLYYSNLSKQWAIGDGLIQSADYSSKHYANISAENAEISATNARVCEDTRALLQNEYTNYTADIAQTAETAITGLNEAVTLAQSDIASTVQVANTEINSTSQNAKSEITSTKNTAVTQITQEGQKQIQNIESTGFYMRDNKLYFINTDGVEEEFKSGGGGGLEIGDIGIALLGIDETKGLRRYLNGQVIIQDQYVEFTTKVKNAMALYPSIVCTEQQWQATVTMSTFGACYKFVVDDTAGTIRLPKITGFIQGLTDLASLGDLVEAGLPNITAEFEPKDSSYGNYWDSAVVTSGAFTKINRGNQYQITSTSVTTANSQSLGFDASKSNPTYGNSPTVQPESGRYPYFIQVATGAETEADITNELELNNPFFFGMSQYFETEPNNLSWLKSAGQYNSKATYPSYYDWLLTEYNNPTTPNVDVMGTPTFNNGVYSDFATANYVRIPETFTNTSKPWEFVIPLKITSYGTMAQYIFCSESYGFGLNVGADGKLQTYISSNGTSWNINSGRVSSLTIALNTQYYIKTAWTGTQYVVSVSTDKQSYTTYITVDSTSPIAPSLFKFGTGRATAGQSLLYGEINIFEASLTSNGNVWWKGLSAKNIRMSTEAYTDYDWVINSADETFRLPLKTRLASGKAVVGNEYGLGLTPVVPGSAYTDYVYYLAEKGSGTSGTAYFSDYFTEPQKKLAELTAQESGISNNKVVGVTTDSTKSGIETSDSGLYLYFYVGETVQNAHLINAGRIEEKLVDKVDTNASNFTTEGKSLISSYGMPANKSTKLTLGASGSTYTAPANGYFFVSKVSGIANGFIQLANANARWMTSISHCNIATNWAITWLPAKKGDVIHVTYNATGDTNTFEFIYSEGDK